LRLKLLGKNLSLELSGVNFPWLVVCCGVSVFAPDSLSGPTRLLFSVCELDIIQLLIVTVLLL